jgi:hypothetical protein
MYKYKFQEVLYEVVGNILNQRNKLFYAICNTIVFLIYLVLPIIIYIINMNNRPVDQNYINSINTKCTKGYTGDTLKASMLNATCMGFISVGFMYGILMLQNNKREDVFFFLGKW